MSPNFKPTPGARGYQHSCTPVFSSLPLLATLDLIDRAGGIETLAEKGQRLTNTLESLLKESKFYRDLDGTDGVDTPHFKIITPPWPQRGSQLSLLMQPPNTGLMPRVFERMVRMGVIGDEREPDVIRLTPVALYNTFSELLHVAQVLERALEAEVLA